ncbi:MAG: 5'/3'-nucleotidase SurE [Prosthecobacter sp.]|nr:5'/3'-nucleotidase SurE [Prosthecobacter sp.]
MHLLLTNDDGLTAPGLQALEQAVSSLPGCRISIVAPETEQSMCGHCVTTRKPIAVKQTGAQRWAVNGPSADCVRIALFALDLKPDWVLSGVNAGGNMGQDVVISGTLAAAREAAYHGIKAIAFSHYLIKDMPVDWRRVSAWTRQVFELLRQEPPGDAELWNVNFPHHPPGDLPIPSMQHCDLARSPLNVSFEGLKPDDDTATTRYHYTASYAERPRDAGSDVEVCFGGAIALSKLRL